jgi:thioredoxin-related protein
MALTFARRQDLSRYLSPGLRAGHGALSLGALSMGVMGIVALATVAACASPSNPPPAAVKPAIVDPAKDDPAKDDPAKDAAVKNPAAARPAIYNPQANAQAEIEAALKTAKLERMRVLVVFGGNRRTRCDKLHDLFKENKEIATILRSQFVQVLVDVDTQQKVFDQYVKQSEQQRVPFLTVLDSDGAVLVNQETGTLEAGPKHDPQKVKAFLEKWSLPALDADKVFADAVAQAKRESKRILLHVGPPRIVWSRMLDQFFDQNASLFASDFVNLQIDQERMTNGGPLIKRLRPEKSWGFPWFAILDAEGTPLVTSDASGSDNIGYPLDPREIGYFMQMLHKTILRTTPEQLALIEKKLHEGREQYLRGSGKRSRILRLPRRI